MEPLLQYSMWILVATSAIVLFMKLYDHGADLKTRIKKLGGFDGKSKEECIKKLWKPKETEYHEDGSSTITWAAGKVLISVLFDSKGIFSRIVKEVM